MGTQTAWSGSGTDITWSSGLPSNPVIDVAGGQPIIVESSRTKDKVNTVTYDTLNIEVGQR
jgi:hypothetical protein